MYIHGKKTIFALSAFELRTTLNHVTNATRNSEARIQPHLVCAIFNVHQYPPVCWRLHLHVSPNVVSFARVFSRNEFSFIC